MNISISTSISLDRSEICELIIAHIQSKLKVRVESIDFDFENTPDSVDLLYANVIINSEDNHHLIKQPETEAKQTKKK